MVCVESQEFNGASVAERDSRGQRAVAENVQNIGHRYKRRRHAAQRSLLDLLMPTGYVGVPVGFHPEGCYSLLTTWAP